PLQRTRHQSASGVLLRMVGGEAAGDQRELGLALRHRDTRTKAPEDVDEPCLTIAPPRFGALTDRREDIRLAVERDARPDAGYRVGLSFEHEALADRRGTAGETPPPESVADDGDWCGAGAIVFGAKCAPLHERHAEHRKQVRRDLPPVHVFGIA